VVCGVRLEPGQTCRPDLPDLVHDKARPRHIPAQLGQCVRWQRHTFRSAQAVETFCCLAQGRFEIPKAKAGQGALHSSEVMAARHAAFTSRVLSALRAHDVAAAVIEPHEGLKVARGAMYREISGSEWRPSLPGDKVMARCPEDGVTKPKADCLLWPPIKDQLFYCDAVTKGGQRVEFGDNAYGCVDMYL